MNAFYIIGSVQYVESLTKMIGKFVDIVVSVMVALNNGHANDTRA